LKVSSFGPLLTATLADIDGTVMTANYNSRILREENESGGLEEFVLTTQFHYGEVEMKLIL
jgi:hypothetical protein